MGFFCHIHMMDNFLTNEISIVPYHYYLMDFSIPFTFKKKTLKTWKVCFVLSDNLRYK